jgi:hypothetical protein
MSYEPSHRRVPPRQARWPHATPQEGWPAHLRGDGDQYGDQARELQAADHSGWAADAFTGAAGGFGLPDGHRDGRDGYAWAGNGYEGGYAGMAGEDAGGRTSHPWNENGHDGYGWARPGYGEARNGYGGTRNGDGNTRNGYGGTRNGNGEARNGYGGTRNGNGDTRNGYGGTRNGYGEARNAYGEARNGYGGHDGYAGDAFPGSAGFPDQLDRGEFAEPRPSGPLLIAPDTIGEPGWLRDESEAPRGERDRSQLIIGAVTGFLAAAVAIGFATLAAAFVRPQASPVIAVGGAFIDRTPPALKNFAVEHFGENDKTVLLLGMYVMIALIAVAVGCLARQRGVTIGVAGIAAFGLFGAFVAITRPESRPTDVIPSVIGGIAGVIALLWLDRRAAPLAPLQPARGGGRRRRAR